MRTKGETKRQMREWTRRMERRVRVAQGADGSYAIYNWDIPGKMLRGWPHKAPVMGLGKSLSEAWDSFLSSFASRRLLGLQ